MSWWGKNTKVEPYIVNVPNLQKYHEIVSEKGTKFNVGDIIKLKKKYFFQRKMLDVQQIQKMRIFMHV